MSKVDRERGAARAQATIVPANSVPRTTKPRTRMAPIREDDASPALSSDAVVNHPIYQCVSLRISSELGIDELQSPTSMTYTTNETISANAKAEESPQTSRWSI